MATSNLAFNIFARDKASQKFLGVAAAARLTKGTFDDLNESAAGLAKMVGGSGLVPVLGVAASHLTSLTTSLVGAAGATGVFGLSVGGIALDMKKAQDAIAKTDMHLQTLNEGSQEYKDTLEALHQQQRDFNKDFGPAASGMNVLVRAFDKFKDSTRGVTTNVMGDSMRLLASALPKLVPVSNAAGEAFGGLIDELQGWVDGPSFTHLMDFFQGSGSKAITTWGHIISNTVQGIAGVLANFVGPGDEASAALERITKNFADWSKSKGTSASVQKFLDFANNNGDKVAGVLASLADITPKLASSLGQLGSANLSAIEMFLNLLSGMNQGTFDVVVTGLFGVAAATKAVSAAMAINTLITGVAAAFTAFNGTLLGTRVGLAALAAQEYATAAASLVMAAGQKVANAAMLAGGWVKMTAQALGYAAAMLATAAAAKVVAAASKAWAAAQWVLNAALNANPISLIVLAIAGLVAGVIIAYRKVSWFRAGVDAAMKGIAAAGRWMWNNVLRPVLMALGKYVGFILTIWAKMLQTMGKVPGFGWAKKAGDALEAAAYKANHLGDAIGKIPSHKDVSINIKVTKSTNATVLDHEIGGNASGTTYWGGGRTVVGEVGPEIVTLPRGSRIHSNAESKRMGGGGGDVSASAPLVIQVDGRQLWQGLVEFKRKNGIVTLGLG